MAQRKLNSTSVSRMQSSTRCITSGMMNNTDRSDIVRPRTEWEGVRFENKGQMADEWRETSRVTIHSDTVMLSTPEHHSIIGKKIAQGSKCQQRAQCGQVFVCTRVDAQTGTRSSMQLTIDYKESDAPSGDHSNSTPLIIAGNFEFCTKDQQVSNRNMNCHFSKHTGNKCPLSPISRRKLKSTEPVIMKGLCALVSQSDAIAVANPRTDLTLPVYR